jgi:hypothetical protein
MDDASADLQRESGIENGQTMQCRRTRDNHVAWRRFRIAA